MYTPTNFLIRCQLPSVPYHPEPELIVAQSVAVDRLLLSGALLQYAVAEDEGQWWAIIPAHTEWEARQLAASLPWCDTETMKITALSYFARNETEGFSLN